jgi:AraC-like DNA-binding protein
MPEIRTERPPDYISRQVSSARRFYLPHNPTRSPEVRVLCGGWEACAPDFRIERPDFPYVALEYVAAGRGDLLLGGRRHALAPGCLFTYGPGIPQVIQTDPADPLGKYFVNATGPAATRLLARHGLRPGTVVAADPAADVRVAFDTLIRLGDRPDAHTARAVALQFELLLIAAGRSVAPTSPAERQARATFLRCRDHIDTHFLRLRGVADIARECHLDASYLSRLFRRFLGDTPLHHLRWRQMQWAAERLHGSDRLAREVADELGLDPFLFSRIFKRLHGVSPRRFLGGRG